MPDPVDTDRGWRAGDWGTIPGGIIHILTVVFPLVQSYTNRNAKAPWAVEKIQSIYRRFSEGGSEGAQKSPKPEKKGTMRRTSKDDETASALFTIVLDNDPIAFEAFKKFAVGDFSAENPMFYQEYRALMFKVRAALDSRHKTGADAGPQAVSGTSRSTKKTAILTDAATSLYPTPPSPVEPASHSPRPSFRSSTQLDVSPVTPPQSLPGRYLEPALSTTPMPPHLLPECRKLFRGFVAPGASLQLNLSAHIVDDISRRLKTIPKTGQFTFNEPIPGITVSIFDNVRDEVLRLMWDAFPRFIDKERNGCLKEYISQRKRVGGFFSRTDRV
ncbi:hypothetical protein HDV00_001508 [Rhizophlyctis rosea]|nr:hypothetical protein HDV00_001508 [Rhizophlyctis rosea]